SLLYFSDNANRSPDPISFIRSFDNIKALTGQLTFKIRFQFPARVFPGICVQYPLPLKSFMVS
ncbi:MAG: hypothetical protein LRY55_03885, partial [Leadbetterella sp.]|nr:hypothetical protein [Leadbetterella sp.]